MAPITKDPKRRIRRIQRWLKFRKKFDGRELSTIIIDPLELYPTLHFKSHKYVVNVRRLFRVELAWLCDYAIRITTDHGRATSRLGEVAWALARCRVAVQTVVGGISSDSTPDTVAGMFESVCRELTALRDEKKRR